MAPMAPERDVTTHRRDSSTRGHLRKRSAPWTADEIRALGVRVDGVTACEIVYNVGRTRAYELLGAGEVDFPVIHRGRRYVVPTSALVALLGLGEDDQGAA